MVVPKTLVYYDKGTNKAVEVNGSAKHSKVITILEQIRSYKVL
jgi:hypothetical protein